MRSRIITAVCAAVTFFSVPTAWANLSIDKLWVEFANGLPGRSDVVIRNDSEERYYIDVTVDEILNPGTEAEERVSIADPEARGLLVTPNRMILEPGALRSIRLVSLNDSLTKDRIYRVMVKPQVGTITSDAPVLEGSPSIVMKIMAAYDVLVVARPSNSKAIINSERTDNELTLTNAGNTNILLAEGVVCPANTRDEDRDEKCTSIEATRIYSGNVLKIPTSAITDVVEIKTRDDASASLVTIKY